MPEVTPILKDEIYCRPPEGLDTHSRRYLIFFITGNPGLIEYYRVFLKHLWHKLGSGSTTDHDVYVYGTSLGGFCVTNDARPSEQEQISASGCRALGLDEQIDYMVQQLCNMVKRLHHDNDYRHSPVPVILIGHSVGAYILLEIIARWRRMPETSPGDAKDKLASESNNEQISSSMYGLPSKQLMKIEGGICLFPTIVHIAKSRMGRRATPLLSLPNFAAYIHNFARMLFSWLDLWLLTRIISWLAWMPMHPAAYVTAAFLQSKMGVFSALWMAKDEMRLISEDKWSDEFWGMQPLADLTVTATESQTRVPVRYDNAGAKSEDRSASTTGLTDMLHSSRKSSKTGIGVKETEDVTNTAATQRVREWSESFMTGKKQSADVDTNAVKLFFYWGRNDHWVANKTRDAIITRRARRGRHEDDNKAVMEIDQHEIPHAFCLKDSHSILIANKVAEYMREIVAGF